MPGTRASIPARRGNSRRTSGSPPVSRTSVTPIAAITLTRRSISSKRRTSARSSHGSPSAGMQYWQRKLQRSVTDTRRSEMRRPWPSNSGSKLIWGRVATIRVSEGRSMRVSVVGGGLMGSGIAEVCARSGLDVTVVETDGERAEHSRAAIEHSLARAVKSGKLPKDERDAALERLAFSAALDDVEG